MLKFEENLFEELKNLRSDLESLTYQPKPLKKFIIRDPKTRTIHSSAFKDRVVHHALVNILSPIFEKSFIHDSYANQLNKGTHKAVLRFDYFKKKISNNGRLIKNPHNKNSVTGYVLKADIRHYFDTVDHGVLLNIIERRVKDKKAIWLINKILNNFDQQIKGKGMPLGNLTSQFFANVYLNELDQFVKHKLKIKYYIRYVDDFIIFDKEIKKLEYYKNEISRFLRESLLLELHPDKSKIRPLMNGLLFLGYRIFYNHKLLRKSNLKKFKKEFEGKLVLYKKEILSKDKFLDILTGWFGYARLADTYNLRKEIAEFFQQT